MNRTSAELSEIFPGDTQMAEVMRSHDWASTPLGDARQWPDALKIPLRMLLTSKFEMWLGWGPDLHFFYNDAYIPTLGIKHPVMLGQPFREVWSEVYDEVADQVDKVRAGVATWNKALLLLLERSGYPEETYHSFSYSPLYEADGSVGGLLCVVSEETSRIISERRLETLRDLGTALAGATDGASVREAALSAFAANCRDFPFAALCLAGDEEAVAAMDASDSVMFRKFAAELGSKADEVGQVFALPAGITWPSGHWDRSPHEAISISIPDPVGEAAAGWLVLGLNPYRHEDPDILDIARLMAGQISGALANIATLQAERRRADRIWTFSRDLMLVIDAEGVFRSVSPAWTRMLGHPADEVVGQHFSNFVHPEDVSPSGAALGQALVDQQLTNYENRFLTVDGGYRWIEWQTSMENGLVYAYGRDITDRRLAENALTESQEQFRHLVQGVTDYAIYMIDLEGHVSSWNEGARRIKGYEPEDIIGKHFSRFYTEQDQERGEPARALETARREGRFSAEGWRVRKNGERFRASVVIDAIRDDAGRPIGFAKITRDITERDLAQRELETAREALFQSQKMEAIGQLTGGVAHDFNNLLMAILSSLDLLRKRIPEDQLTQRLLNNAFEGAQRGATLTQRMLAFARRQDLKVDRVDLPQLLSGMSDLVQRSIGPEWPISTSLPLGLPAIYVDANQLEMALLNLIVNARDATPSGGPIVVSAYREEVGQRRNADLAEGSYVRLAVKDQGSGMDEETLRRATEPFFTTKGVGKGTGLGLPMVHGMAQQIGGAFELLSIVGEGTSAVLWLPLAREDTVRKAPKAVDETLPLQPHLTVLAVDDDTLVLMNTAALLEDMGHDVIEADSAAEALEVLRARSDIDLIITDQAMPNMTGVDFIGQADLIRPGVPKIIASGYGEGVQCPHEVVRLSKPFNQQHLARAINKAIDRNGGVHSIPSLGT
jgi:PAS domain S-box-containing protein